MYRKCLTVFAGLLSVAAFALLPGDALARSGGGRGGSWGGGSRGGSWGGGGRGGYYGGRGGYYGGRGWGWGGWGIGIGLGSPYYGGYGYGRNYWPGYYSSYDSYPYYGGDMTYDSYPNYADTGSSFDTYPSYSSDMMDSGYAYGAPTQNNDALIRVVVPPDAKVWFNDHMTQQSGSTRLFETPALTPGQTFHYDLKAKWLDKDGKEVTRTKRVDVNANSRATVDFAQALNPEQAPAPNPKK